MPEFYNPSDSAYTDYTNSPYVEPSSNSDNIPDEIPDDTGLSLTESLNFQQVSHTDDASVQRFLEGDETVNSAHKLPASRNPVIRLTVGLCLVMFGVGFMLMMAMLTRKPEMAEAPVDTEAGAEESELTLSLTDNPKASSSIAPEDMSTDQMKSEIALLEQRLAIAQLEDPSVPSSTLQSNTAATRATTTRNTGAGDTPTTSTSSSPTATPVATRPTSPSPTVVRPVIRQPPARPVVSSPPAPRPVARNTPPVSNSSSLRPPSSPIPTFSPSEPVDQNEKWVLLSNTGTMGIAPVPTEEPVETAVEVVEPTEAETFPAEYALKSDSAPSATLVSYVPTKEGDYKLGTVKASVPGLHDPQMSHIPIGQTAMAVTPHSISWGMTDAAQFTIDLTSDLLDASGNVALAAGDKLIVQVGRLDQSSGMAELIVVGVSRDGLTTAVDYTSFMIAGADGGALMAENTVNGRGTLGNDVGRLAIGVLGSIGREITKPSSQTVVNSAYGSTTSTNNSGTNIAGAILADGTDAVLDRMEERNEDIRTQLEGRAPVWQIPGGTEMMVLVNQEISSL